MTSPAPDLPPDVHSAAHAVGGAARAWSRAGGTSGETWRRVGARCDLACTRTRTGRAWSQWRDAATATAGAPWAPTVVAIAEPWIVCTWIDGAVATPTARTAAAAARVLASLRRCPWPVDDDELPATDALRRRIAALRERVRGHGDLEADARRLSAVASSLRDVRRVPCHRDPRPGNWIDTGDGLALIDYEHARLDVAGTDEAVMWCTGWFDAAVTRTAFVEAAGADPFADDAFVLLAGLRALGTVARSRSGGEVPEPDGGEARLAAWRDLATS